MFSTKIRLLSRSIALRPKLSVRSVAAPASSHAPAYAELCMTKVVCTLGPSTETSEKVNSMSSLGMAVARLNFSHVKDYSEPLAKLELVRAAPGKHHSMGWENVPPNLRAVLVDTKGPEIRTGPLPGGVEAFEIEDGMAVILTHADVSGDSLPEAGDNDGLRLHVDYPSIATTVKVGGSVLLDDGLIALEVLRLDPQAQTVYCMALNAGPIKANKGVNLPGATLDLPALTNKDKEDLRWAVGVGADYVAASFIRSAANVRSCIAHLERCCDEVAASSGQARPLRPLVISKIESEEGVDNFAEILEASDGIMVARGDLGVEIPFEKVFAAQKMMVRECNVAGKPVIVATQMLDSMIRMPRPTRAEVTDVGSAVLDGADAVMLSGETAAGKYPLQSLQAMRSILAEADTIADSPEARTALLASGGAQRREWKSAKDPELAAVAAASVKTAQALDAKVIVCITSSGDIARAVASCKPSMPVVAFCFDPAVARRLQLHRAIHPLLVQGLLSEQAVFDGETSSKLGPLRQEVVRTAKELGWVESGDRVVCVDRNTAKYLGQSSDAIRVGTNLKVFTVV